MTMEIGVSGLIGILRDPSRGHFLEGLQLSGDYRASVRENTSKVGSKKKGACHFDIPIPRISNFQKDPDEAALFYVG